MITCIAFEINYWIELICSFQVVHLTCLCGSYTKSSVAYTTFLHILPPSACHFLSSHARAAPRIWRWGGGQCIGRWGVNTVKTLKFEKGGECISPPPPPRSYNCGTAPEFPCPYCVSINMICPDKTFPAFRGWLIPNIIRMFPLLF